MRPRSTVEERCEAGGTFQGVRSGARLVEPFRACASTPVTERFGYGIQASGAAR